ncbi:MAG: hypothetical protein IT236_10530 [Bacteroidia bacterium]|nr:hypothetical protein [Bacteroidia bacterium]
MTEHSNKIADDEIDLGLFRHWLNAIFVYPLSLLFSNVKTTLVFLILALLVSFGLKFALTKTYKCSFIIRPNERNERVHVRMLNDVQSLLKLGDSKGLAQELKVDLKMAKSIESMEVTNFAFAKDRADSSNTSLIILELKDYSQALPIQNAILNYLENNPYFKKIKGYQKTNIELKTQLIDKDILFLDSLKKMQLSNYDKLKVNETTAILLKDLINPTATYTLSLERLNQKAGLLGQSMFLDNFQLVKGVVVSEKHSWPPRTLIMLIFFIPVFLILCVLFLHIKSRRSSKKILA